MEIKNMFYQNIFGSINYKFNYTKIYGILSANQNNVTIFMELLRGLIKPTSGTIETDKEKSFLLFEESTDQIFNETVEKEILYGLNDIELESILDELAIDKSFLKLNPLELSNGEKRKIVFASMLAFNPDIILIDNFLNGLDYKTQTTMINILKQLQYEQHKTIIIADRNIDLLFSLVDDVVILDDGILLSGNKIDVFKNYCIINRLNIEIPKCINFSKEVLETKGIELGYRDRVTDIMKDVYDNV